MSKPHVTATEHDKPWRCELCIKGLLDDRCAAWFDGLSLTHASDGTAILAGPVGDQAALHGLLQNGCDLDLRWPIAVPLTAVRRRRV
jgi:hypothetical protein